MSDNLRAQRHLARRDPVLKQLIKLIGPCTLEPQSNHFHTLVGSIISQQISTKAASSIRTKLVESLALHGLKPSAILQASDDQLRAAGLSTAKRLSLKDLAGRIHSGQLRLDDIHEQDDEGVIERLIPVRGIGRWTAQMFLIFSLGRLDVLPTADLGLRAGVKKHYGLDELPTVAALEELAEKWKPYRSVGTWYVWRGLAATP